MYKTIYKLRQASSSNVQKKIKNFQSLAGQDSIKKFKGIYLVGLQTLTGLLFKRNYFPRGCLEGDFGAKRANICLNLNTKSGTNLCRWEKTY